MHLLHLRDDKGIFCYYNELSFIALNDAEKTKLIQDPEVQEMMKRMIGNPPPPPPPPGA